ncbi:hypothetical protein F2Q70_00039646 [Brassica cretica]|uniref:Uncharacterized protein n=1 Tax=Brassica cretica TaxID=69181 RepID=A0A8S9K785_BRACR|nr:hypothetical protein F2Q70_00039646 [Brassica cretica]
MKPPQLKMIKEAIDHRVLRRQRFGKKKMAESKALSAFESMWSIKKEEMALKERVTKMKLLDSLLAKKRTTG